MRLQELLKKRSDAEARLENQVSLMEASKHNMPDYLPGATREVQAEIADLNRQIRVIESSNSITRNFPSFAKTGVLLTDEAPHGERIRPRVFSREYESDLLSYIQSNGKKVGATLLDFADPLNGFPLVTRGKASAALYEGTDSAGGYAVPIVVDDQIVPLAPQEMAVRRLAAVIPTSSDLKIPVKAAFGTAAAKAETAAFGGTPTSLEQFTLSAFMAGQEEQISWELAQDVPAFQSFVVDDMILGQQMYEENLYVNGTGSGQAQGLIGNVGVGGTYEPDTNSNLVSVSGTLNLIGTLNAAYHPNASWLMTRATSVIIRQAQVESNLFNPVWTRVGEQDFLHGYPVYYSASMPAAARGAAPLLFGDFKRGYLIGDRGGSGINVKVLDQPLANQGLLVLLTYRRTDGRVRRTEAIQQYNIASS
jgi:HK97 family phage major capsid protein